LLNGGADYAQMRAATSRRDELDARARDTERRLHQEVDNALTNLASSKRRFSTVSEEVAINLKVVEAFRAQLVEGNRPLLDVLDAYQRYHQSRLDLAQIAVAEGQAMLRVAHFTGQLQGLLASNPAPAN
jgi:adhesin transport system outer membrane protein